MTTDPGRPPRPEPQEDRPQPIQERAVDRLDPMERDPIVMAADAAKAACILRIKRAIAATKRLPAMPLTAEECITILEHMAWTDELPEAPSPRPEPQHVVNPETGRCVLCGRNAFNRERTPVCDFTAPRPEPQEKEGECGNWTPLKAGGTAPTVADHYGHGWIAGRESAHERAERLTAVAAAKENPMSEPRPEPQEVCQAAEWHRDGRGLWAMRSCRYYADHGKSHYFGSWKYNQPAPGDQFREALRCLPRYTEAEVARRPSTYEYIDADELSALLAAADAPGEGR